jgi:WD40 repeat protein
VWDVESGRRLWSTNHGSANCLEFTPDGKALIVGGVATHQIPPREDHTFLFLNADTGAEQRRIELGTRNPERMVFSSDGTRLLAICWGGKALERGVLGWDLASGRKMFEIDPPTNERFRGQDYSSAITIAPSGKSFFTAGGFDGLIEWDCESGKELRRFGHGVFAARDITISPDGKTIAAAGPGSEVMLVDVATGQGKSPGSGGPCQINTVAIAPDGKTVLTVTPSPAIYCWDLTTGKLTRKIESPEKEPWYYSLADDCRSAIATNYETQAFRVMDVPSGQERSRFSLHMPDFNYGLVEATVKGGKPLAVKNHLGDKVYLVDPATGQSVSNIQDAGLKSCQAHILNDGRTMFVFCANHTVQVWDVEKRAKLRQFGPMGDSSSRNPQPLGTDYEGYTAVVSPDGTRVAYYNRHGYLSLIESTEGQEMWRLDKLQGGPSAMAFSPDGRMLVHGDWETPVLRSIEVATGKERQVLKGHRGQIYSLAFSRDLSTLVSGSTDTTALVWDLTGRLAAGQSWDGQPSPADLDLCWAALAGEDAAKAYLAVQRLAASPREAVPYLAQRLRPIDSVDDKVVDRLINALDSDKFADREKAANELDRLGDTALARCRKALAGLPSGEARRRLESFIEKQAQEQKTPSHVRLRALRALEALERAGTPEARRLLEALAQGAPEALQTQQVRASLARLNRRDTKAP